MTQTLVLDTIVEEKKILAPDNWEFDKTTTLIWNTMLDIYKHENKIKLKRDVMIRDAKVNLLGNILANVLSMSSTYWVMEAREHAALDFKP